MARSGNSTATIQFQDILGQNRPDLSSYEELYKHFHQNPEISTLEENTSTKIESHLRSISPHGELDIRTKIGGHGLIAICKNGSGPTVLLRADMDGMPVSEKTGLSYASSKTQKDDLDGQVKQVMHACGHDFHITSLLAAAETMLAARKVWSGTVIFLFQPAEERGSGARDMVNDGLYDPNRHACPVPDICMAQHVYPELAGSVQTKSGPFFSAADSYRITIYGSGGHGSMPHRCIDPVVVACHVVIRFQTIVSREIPPDETAVITVGSIQSGDTVNVISDEAILQVNIRSVSEKWRKTILDSIKRIVDGECGISRCPKPATIEKLNDYPLTENDEEATERIQESFVRYFSHRHGTIDKALLASEDFSHLATAVGKPYVYWTFGGIDRETWDMHDKANTLDQISVNHSPFFKPAIQPTLQTGVDALVVAALTYVGTGSHR